MGEGEGGGVLFHCSTGKDRMGVIAALILAFFGASEEEIVLDYELTWIEIELHRDRLLQGIVRWAGGGLEQRGLESLSSERGENILGFLSWMEGEWGGVVVEDGYKYEEGRKWNGADVWLIKECRVEIGDSDKITKSFVKSQGAMGFFLAEIENDDTGILILCLSFLSPYF